MYHTSTSRRKRDERRRGGPYKGYEAKRPRPGRMINMKNGLLRCTVNSYHTISFSSSAFFKSSGVDQYASHSDKTTRGYLIFKYNGIYYVIYNQFDSYVAAMGVANMEVLRKLCKDFNGNVALARQHLRPLFEALVARSMEAAFDNEGNPPSDYVRIWEKTYDGFSLAEMSDFRSVVGFEAISKKPPRENFEIDYMWEVDLDAGRLGMGRSNVFTHWSWRALYLMTAADWEEDAETHARYWRDGYVISNTPYDRTYKAILIQTAIRRFLALRRALRPPDGYLFHRAKREFEALQNGR